MIYPQAIKYIKDQLSAGYSEEEIRDAMEKAGWRKKDIEDSFQGIKPERKERHLLGFLASFVGGLAIVGNSAMEYVFGDSIKIALATGFVLLPFDDTTLIMASLAMGICVILFSVLLKLKPSLDLVFGILITLIGTVSILSSDFLVLGGIISIIGGTLTILRK
jgi:hypothetical protein